MAIAKGTTIHKISTMTEGATSANVGSFWGDRAPALFGGVLVGGVLEGGLLSAEDVMASFYNLAWLFYSMSLKPVLADC